MRSIHTTNQQNYNKNNTPYRVVHKHRTKLGNPIRGIILPITSIITLSSAFFVGISATYAEGSSVSLSVDNSDTVLELTVPESVSLNLTPSSTNNYNPSGTASLNVSAGTNNITGYTLTMSVPNTNLVNSSVTITNNPNNIPLDSSNHPIIPTITSTYSDSNFPDNAWGYRIGNTNYSPVSSSISLPGSGSAGNATTTNLELIAKVNATQPAGTYTTAFNFLMVAKPTSFTVTWNPNGGTVSPATSTHRYGSQIGTLPTPTYTGYDFLGWFTQATGGLQITSATTVTADTTYYAHWEKANPFNTAFANAGKSKQGDYYKMQDMSAPICSAITTPTTTTEDVSTQLIDTRDNKVYWVSKLADGHCWMTQNLDYDIKADGTDIIATIGGGTTTTWNAAYPAHATETTLSNHTNNTDTYSWDPGDYYVENGGGSSDCSTWRPSSDCQSTKAAVSLTSADAKGNANLHYHLGNYYQWNTATAGYGGTETGKDITQSICPKGWRLPTSNSYTNNYSFGKLTNAYGITNSTAGSSDANLLSSPLWFVRAGDVSNGSLIAQGSYGYVWSSRALAPFFACSLYFYSSFVVPGSNGRPGGYSVRCVAE